MALNSMYCVDVPLHAASGLYGLFMFTLPPKRGTTRKQKLIKKGDRLSKTQTMLEPGRNVLPTVTVFQVFYLNTGSSWGTSPKVSSFPNDRPKLLQANTFQI